MTAYFDEAEIKKRVTQRLRRRFLLTIHIFFALAIFLVAAFHGVYIQETYNRMQFDLLLWRNILAVTFIVGVIPLIPHLLWVRYRDQVEREIEHELRVSPYAKQKHDEYDDAHLYDTGEFVPSDDDDDHYPQKRLQRR